MKTTKRCLAIILALLLSSCNRTGISLPSPQRVPENNNTDTASLAEETTSAPSMTIETTETTAEVVTQADELTMLRQKAEQADAFCAYSYMGYQYELYSPDFDAASLLEIFPCTEKSALVDASGDDVFVIVPTDENAAVTVERLEMNENGELIPADFLYEGDGTPFVLRCNVSDIFPNTLVTITDRDGNSQSASPFLSLRDGSAVMDGAYDFTEYPEGFVKEE